MSLESIIGNLRAVWDRTPIFSDNKELCVIIRRAEEKDITGIHDLIQKVHCQREMYDENIFRKDSDPVRLANLDNQIIKWIYHENTFLSVAEEGDEILGVLCANRVDIPDNHPIFKKRSFIEVDTLVVRDDSCGLGIGRRLMEEILQWAAFQKIRDIELGVYTFNQRAIDFYEHLGFSVDRMNMRLSL